MSPRPLAISFPPSSLVPKPEVDPSNHPCTDLALKRLRVVSRRLSAVLASFQDESRLLERLFYKGKNQHKISLFWRHVEEIRRLCHRLLCVDLMALVARVRHAFYNSTNYDNNNLLKSSWTHLPNVHSLRAAADTVSCLRPLLKKMSDKFLSAYRSFKCAMQTGAFLQLVLTLSALTCRLRALSETTLEINEELIGILRDLSNTINILHNEPSMPSYGADTVPAMPNRPIQATASDASSRPPDIPGTVTEKAGAPIVQSSTGVPEDNESSQRSKVKKTKPKQLADSSTRPQLKKKKKRLDEIDAIFGQ